MISYGVNKFNKIFLAESADSVAIVRADEFVPIVDGLGEVFSLSNLIAVVVAADLSLPLIGFVISYILLY